MREGRGGWAIHSLLKKSRWDDDARKERATRYDILIGLWLWSNMKFLYKKWHTKKQLEDR